MSSESTTAPSSADEITAQELIEQIWRDQRPTPTIPRWLPPALVLLPYVLISATIINGLIGLIAILTPLFVAASMTGLADGLYTAYSYICPQRPDHTFFLAGHPMAFEQRDLSMHLGFAIAGLMYFRVEFMKRSLPTIWMVAGLMPMLIDVFISTIGWLPSTGLSRTWTGALASFVVVWWSFPRFESMLDRVQVHVERIRERVSDAQPVES